jgi:hypothetical protein
MLPTELRICAGQFLSGLHAGATTNLLTVSFSHRNTSLTKSQTGKIVYLPLAHCLFREATSERVGLETMVIKVSFVELVSLRAPRPS